MIECKSSEIHSYEGNIDNDFMKVEILKRTKAILYLSKYAPLWPCCLLLSTDLYNVLSLHRLSSQMTYPVASSTLDNARSYMMQGALLAQGTVSSIPIVGSISPEGFLPSIVLLVVIIVTVLIVAVILVVVVIAIVGVVIVVVFIGIVVVVGGGVSSIFKLSFVIIGVLRRIMFYYLLHQPLSYGWAYAFHPDKASSVRVQVANVTLFSLVHLLRENNDLVRSNLRMRPVDLSVPCTIEVERIQWKILEFKTSRDRYRDNRMSDPIGGLEFLGSLGFGSLPNGRVDLTGDKDPTDEDGDTRMGNSTGILVSLGGEISSGGKKSWELNIGGSNNTGDRGKIAGRAIIAWGGRITSYACMTFIYGSL
ncbi:hypothetical protein Tco_1341031 [Tanacetum coccineum]